MAGYRISSVLYTFPCAEEAPGCAKNYAYIGWGFPLHVENSDGEVESASIDPTADPVLMHHRRMIGVLSPVSLHHSEMKSINICSETLTAHRAQCLLDQLPNALVFGLSEIEPEIEPLKVRYLDVFSSQCDLISVQNLDTDLVIDVPDTSSRFQLAEAGHQQEERESKLAVLIKSWDQHDTRHHQQEDQWTTELEAHLSHLVDMRIEHVREWIASNLSRFKAEHANVEALRRAFETSVVDLRANILICKLQCRSCHLSCLQGRHHEGSHDCKTDHKCIRPCDFSDDHEGEQLQCGFR